MKKMLVPVLRAIALSLVLLVHGQTMCTKFGSDPATFSPSITIKNKSGYDLQLLIEVIGTNNQASFIHGLLAKDTSQDVPRVSNGMITKSIQFTTLNSKLKGSYTIGDRESVITITNNDLK